MSNQDKDNVMILLPRDTSREILLISTNHQIQVFKIAEPLENDVIFDQILYYMEARDGYATFDEAKVELLQYCDLLETDEQTLRATLIDALFQMFNKSVENA